MKWTTIVFPTLILLVVACNEPRTDRMQSELATDAMAENEPNEVGPPEVCEDCKCADKDADGKSLYDALNSNKLQSCYGPYYACKVTNAPVPATYTRDYCEYADEKAKTGCGIKSAEATFTCHGSSTPECQASQQPTYRRILSCKEATYTTKDGTVTKYCTSDKYGDDIQGPKLYCDRKPEWDYKGRDGYDLISTCTYVVDADGKGTCLGTCSLAKYVPNYPNGSGCKRDLTANSVFNTSFACEAKPATKPAD